MLATARTFSLVGIEAREVHVEVDVGRGLPAFSVVGLPDAAVRESRERVRSALTNSGFEFPLRRITANLAPADLRKVGPGFDLAIAAALLVASGQLPAPILERWALAGELALDGAIRPVAGVLAMAEAARDLGMHGIAVAESSGPEAGLVEGVDVAPMASVARLAELLRGSWVPEPVSAGGPESNDDDPPDISDLRGQPVLCRALEVAAAGGHNLLMLGPPGAGKSLAARRLPSLLPPLSRTDALEVTRIASACGLHAPGGLFAKRPFRAPHHTISAAGLIGGGNPARPGEITLAHKGVLFLDELGEFSRPALEAMRQPLEDGHIVLTRSRYSVELPCRFTLVAASNPCPCGHEGSAAGVCTCAPSAVSRYQAKLSGALADRFDICLAIGQPSSDSLSGSPGESSDQVRERVLAARARQSRRLGGSRANADMTLGELRFQCRLAGDAEELMRRTYSRLGLSGRGHDRVLRVARTIADLAGAQRIGSDHLAEALSLRQPARK